MERNTINDNMIKYAFAGLLLLLAIGVFILAYFSNTFTLELSYDFIALALTTVATSVLHRAFRNEMNKLRQV